MDSPKTEDKSENSQHDENKPEIEDHSKGLINENEKKDDESEGEKDKKKKKKKKGSDKEESASESEGEKKKKKKKDVNKLKKKLEKINEKIEDLLERKVEIMMEIKEADYVDAKVTKDAAVGVCVRFSVHPTTGPNNEPNYSVRLC